MKLLILVVLTLTAVSTTQCFAAPQSFKCNFNNKIKVSGIVSSGYGPMRYLEKASVGYGDTTLVYREHLGEPQPPNTSSANLRALTAGHAWLTFANDGATKVYLVGLPLDRIKELKQREDTLKNVPLNATMLYFEAGKYSSQVAGSCIFN